MKTISILQNTFSNEENVKFFNTTEKEWFIEKIAIPYEIKFGGENFYNPSTGAIRSSENNPQGLASVLTHMEYTLWNDNRSKVYSLIFKSFYIKGERGEATEVKYIPHRDTIVRLRVSPSGKLSLTKKGKLVVEPKEIVRWLDLLSFRFFELRSLRLNYPTYMLSRSPKLQRANFPSSLIEDYYAYPKLGRKAYYYLSKGKVAEARSILLAGIPNAPKGLLKRLQEGSALKPRDARELLSEGFDVQLMASLVATYKPGDTRSRHMVYAVKLIHQFPEMKKSVLDILKKGTEEGLRLICDTRLMCRRAEPGDNFRTLKEAHDVLTEREIESLKPVILPRMETLYELPVYEKEGYEIRSVNAHDLSELGRELSICVGYYKEETWLGKVAISAIYKGEKAVACLERVEGHVIQAKLFANKPLKSNTEVSKLVSEWMKLNNLCASTADLKGGNSKSEGTRMEALPERVEAKAKAPKGKSVRYTNPWGGNDFTGFDF